jgi:hypothetical protein
MAYARLGPPFAAAAALLVLGTSTHAAEPTPIETFAPGDPAGVEYVGKLTAFASEHATDLEHAIATTREKSPCARADLSMSLVVKPDGTIAEASPDPAPPQLPDDLLAAVSGAVKAWRAPPTSRAAAVRVRVALGPIPAAAPAESLACGAELLDKGRYRVGLIAPGVERGSWWAVCRPKIDAAGEIRAVTLKLKPFHSDLAGDDPGENTGREVVVRGCDTAAFLFRGLPSAKKGPLKGAKVVEKPDAWDSTADIVFGDATYHLRVSAKEHANAGTTERPWKILLERGDGVEELLAGHTTLAPLLHVRWAGDLDGDGKPDFVLEDHSDGVALALYVSSAAVGANKVRRIATTAWGSRH